MFFSLCKPMDCIIEPQDGKGGLFLGNISAAEDILYLRRLKIKAVLAVCTPYQRYNKSDIPRHKIIPAEDYESFDLSVYFDEGIEFIEEALKTTNVLCHCMAGVSRSASMVIAYLMKTRKWDYFRALKFTREKRSIIYPNSGFVKQLMAFEKKLVIEQNNN